MPHLPFVETKNKLVKKLVCQTIGTNTTIDIVFMLRVILLPQTRLFRNVRVPSAVGVSQVNIVPNDQRKLTYLVSERSITIPRYGLSSN